jgi:hypothetical protein
MKNSILSILLTALIFNFSGCENTKELNEDEQEAAISLILTSKNWTMTSYQTNLNEQHVLYEFIGQPIRIDCEEGPACEHCITTSLDKVNVDFTSKESETSMIFSRYETYVGSCGDDAINGNMPDTTKVFSNSYILDIDKQQLTANFGSPYISDDEGFEQIFNIAYNIVSYSENRIELFGKTTIEGEQLEIKMVLE